MKRISNKTIVTSGGITLLILGVFHMAFWHLFDWANDLPKLSQLNNTIMQMIAICTICYLLLMGLILIICRSEISDSKVGKLVLLSLAIFFTVRLVLEFIFPGGSILMGGILLFCVVIYTVPALRKAR